MKPAAPPFSTHRHARLIAWFKLWLQAFSGALIFLIDADDARLRRKLAFAARMAGVFVFLHVAQGFRPVQHKSWRRPAARGAFLRALIGARLRKRLRAGDPVARFFAILGVMRDLPLEAARLRQRLARGLTRLRAIVPAPESRIGVSDALAGPAPRGVDSS